jgi:hypothetical protein
MSDVPRHRLSLALQCVVMGVVERDREHFARLQAEVLEADRSARLRGEQPPARSRFVEECEKRAPAVAEELVGLIRAKRLKAYELGRDGVFRELAAEFWDQPQSKGVLEEALWKPFGKPLRHAIYLDRSEIENLGRSLGDKASPVARPVSPVRHKPLPASMIREITEALKSLPHLPREQQAKAVREMAKFQPYHITDRNLREAAKGAPVPLGRPRKR